MKIGLLIIATNKYINFVQPLIDSINLYFLKDHNIKIFCFTDDKNTQFQDNVIKINQEHLSWPYITLKRYEIIYNNKKYFNSMDYLYYLDADMLIADMVGNEFLPIEEDLLAVIHPGYFANKIQTFERNPISTAFVDFEHYVYHCGGVQGGKKSKYLTVCKTLMDNINEDLKKGIIAIWHDESHWNNFLIKNTMTYKELDSSYCYPENWNLNIPAKILALDKNHEDIRSKKID